MTGRSFDPIEIENYLKASKLSPHDELVYRLALAAVELEKLATLCTASQMQTQLLSRL